MALTKSAELVRYLQQNPDVEMTVSDIQEFMECSYNHARLFTKRAEVVEVIPGMKPITIKYNQDRDERLRVTNANKPKASYNKQIRQGAEEATGKAPTAPAIDMSKYIQRGTFDISRIKNTIENALGDPKSGPTLKECMAIMVQGGATVEALKGSALLLWECLDYLEKHPNEFKE